MKLFIQLLLPAFLLLASCEYKKIDLESEEDFQFRSSIDTDVCNWLVDEKLISVNQEKFDINVIKRSKKGSQPDISDSLQNDAVNLKGNCSDSNRHVIVKLSGDLYYETPNALMPVVFLNT